MYSNVHTGAPTHTHTHTAYTQVERSKTHRMRDRQTKKQTERLIAMAMTTWTNLACVGHVVKCQRGIPKGDVLVQFKIGGSVG